ncbi:MAG TPA: CAP domain-containing protein [Sphingomicrobium sp.]|nr:CAP domain-containing protein [Sphingomicrobium sp.]
MARMIAVALMLLFAAPAAAQRNFAAEFPGRVLAAHNRERAAVGVPPLVWDNALGTGAAAWAQQLAATNQFEHSDRKARRGIGENLWMGTHGAYSVETMVGGWVSEKRFFMAGIFPNNSRSGNWIDVGHYSQLIWPTTQRIGCALASNGRTDYLVCRYATAGNIDGHWVGPGRPERG